MYDQEKHNNFEETTYQHQQDDEYGLPEAEYNALTQDQVDQEEETPVRPVKREIELEPKKKSSAWPIWVGLIVLLGIGGFSLYYFVLSEEEKPAPTPTMAVVTEPTPEPEVIEETPAAEPWTPPVAKEGTITTISEKTGRYYVVVGSFIDGDMAGDYAKKLAKDGNEVTLIEPTGNRKFYRLGVKGADSFDQAAAELDILKNTFGQEIWIVRY